MDKFYQVICEAIYDLYDKKNIRYRRNENAPVFVIADFINHLNRNIPVRKRNVYLSRELLRKIKNKELTEDYIKILNNFKESFEQGIDMRGHFSRAIYDSKFYDKLLSCWDIQHIHLNTKPANTDSEMAQNRSDYLLFCIINNDSVYFINVENHNRKYVFSMFNLLNTIYDNWEFLLKEKEMPPTFKELKPIINKDEYIDLLRKRNVNMSFFKIRNKIYHMGALTAAGTSNELIIQAKMIIKEINKIIPKGPANPQNIKFIFPTESGHPHYGILSWRLGEKEFENAITFSFRKI